MAKKQNSDKVCPVHEDYTHYKIFFNCRNEDCKHKNQEDDDDDDMESGKPDLNQLPTISLLDSQNTESELLRELYAPTCCERVKRCLPIKRRRGVRGLERNMDDDCLCCTIM
eukprot:734486_1